MEIDFNGIIRYPWRSATRNFKYESRARECRELSSRPRGSYERCPYNRSMRRAVLLRTASRHIMRIPWLRYGTKSFSVMAVIMPGILPLEVFQLRHSAGLPFISGTSAPPRDGRNFFWRTISPGITFDISSAIYARHPVNIDTLLRLILRPRKAQRRILRGVGMDDTRIGCKFYDRAALL